MMLMYDGRKDPDRGFISEVDATAIEAVRKRKEALASDPERGVFQGKCNIIGCMGRHTHDNRVMHFNPYMNRYICEKCAALLNGGLDLKDEEHRSVFHTVPEKIDVFDLERRTFKDLY